MVRSWVGVAAVGIAVVAGSFMFRPSSASPPKVEIVAPRTVASSITVHVSGRVVRPGLVSLDSTGRIADAILAAGGALVDADLSALNLAAPIVDGQQLVIPGRADTENGGSPRADGRVRVNTADAATLESLPGVGPVLAAAIVEHRNSHGPFGVVEDLLDVPGIGESKLAAMRESVIVP